jgi:hypothetical protein
MFKKTTICVGLASAILLQSCALVFSGTKDKIKVRSGTPDNAAVYYNGEKVGEGNCTVKIPKKSIKDATIEVKAPGYETQTFKFGKKLRGGAIFFDCITGFVWLIPDFVLGAVNKATPQKVHYDLQISATNIKTDLKEGDVVLFSFEDLKNVEGTIKTMYPNRAVISYLKKTILNKEGKLVDYEVPFVNISKKQ